MSLRNKISFFLILISLIAVFSTGLLVLQNAVKDKKNYVTELNSVLGPQITNSVDQKVKNLLINLNELHMNLSYPQRLQPAQAAAALKMFKNRVEGVDAVFLKTKQNKLISFALNEASLSAESLSKLGENFEGLDNTILVKDKLRYFKDKLYLTAFDSETFVAILLNDLFFQDSFELARGKPSVLVTDMNVVLFKSNINMDYDSLVQSVPSDIWSRSEIISLELQDQKSKNYLVNFSKSRLLNASAILFAPQASWQDLTAPILKSSFGLVVILILFSILIAYWISKSLAKPIEELCTLTAHVGQGDWKKINISKADREILKLTAAFNRMIENLKKREQELKIAQNKIIHANSLAAVGRMSAGIAHEVKNPLASILGYGQLIDMKIGSAKDPANSNELIGKIREYVKLILDDTRRASKIISDLLTFARQKELQTERKNLVELVKSFEPKLKAICDSNKIHFKLDLEVDEHKFIMVDPDQIYQVAFNLAQNATHALNSVSLENKTLTFEVRTFNEFAEITVTDNGPGISEENLKKIFEPFFSTKKVGEGTGLGLALCYGVIQQHQGSIEVTSELGRKTCFKIRLPLAD